MNKKKSSPQIASQAAKILSSEKSSEIQKKLAASALSQRDRRKQTGSQMENIAAKALQSKKYNETTKSLAGSVLSQANKGR
ncbi:MAG: hypothetical protein J7545_10245 [Roseofilum sp. SBFL]|uniref:hypothetical protein n=1 Tax=unclassified Roseofilum TaxID=2620099 RepID=UPI001B2B5962|nr:MULTISPECIES: hypothetical protein [unclassified Roseofilum]MBP0012682.1 hypothetical protein [Roseofilum sp. SID3]MBP0026351.1 hypothetical protein [Roseofilum sp. SID2]MBP0039992.1 hypothetical protein [Roseofilum sp. SID1]MBP0042337.1 hypothetical protein [Roseofilum sp. SBFL]